MAKVDYTAPGLTVVNIEDLIASLVYGVADYAGASAAQKVRIDQVITLAGQAAATWEGRGFWWSRRMGKFLTGYGTVSHVARAANVATITTAAAHNIVAGSRVRVAGVTTDDFDDDDAFVLTVADTTHFTYANTGSNVAEVADATGTVACHAYPLRTVNSSALTDFFAPLGVFCDGDFQCAPGSKYAYDSWISLYGNDVGGQPMNYCLWEEVSSTYSGAMMMGLWPTPDSAAHVIRVPYLRRHSAITSAGSTDTALLVPAEWRWGAYVSGGKWALTHEVVDMMAFGQCPEFVETMERMSQNYPGRFDMPNGHGLPVDRRHFVVGDGDTFINNPITHS